LRKHFDNPVYQKRETLNIGDLVPYPSVRQLMSKVQYELGKSCSKIEMEGNELRFYADGELLRTCEVEVHADRLLCFSADGHLIH